MRMHQFVLSIVTLALSASVAFAQGGTEFTYQGRLLDAGQPADGTFNVEFRLWDDPAAGIQVGSTNTFNSLPILEGIFTVELDFGASAFDNNDRWLEITVDGVPLLPRQPITRTPYAIQTRGIVVNESGQVGIGIDDPISIHALHVETDGFSAAYAIATSLSGLNHGVFGASLSTAGRGVYGIAANPDGSNYGLFGESYGASGYGVCGRAISNIGINYGVYGRTYSSDGYAGYFEGGRNYFQKNVGIGTEDPQYPLQVIGDSLRAVSGETDAEFGSGVYGLASRSVGINYGLRGDTNSPDGYAGYFEGGRNYFEGDVGIGTEDPTERLHITGGADNDGTTASLRITRGSSSILMDGNEIDTIDSALYLNHNNPNDVYLGTAGGYVGVGTDSPGATLHVSGPAAVNAFRVQVDGTTRLLVSDTGGVSGGVVVGANTDPQYELHVAGDAGKPGGGMWAATSDRRLKKNVQKLNGSLQRLLRLRGVTFEYKDPDKINESPGQHIGLIAQEVEPVFPEWVHEAPDGYLRVSEKGVTALTVEALRELREEKDSEISSLRAEKDREIRAIRAETDAEIAALQNRLDSLEQMVAQLASTAEEPPK